MLVSFFNLGKKELAGRKKNYSYYDDTSTKIADTKKGSVPKNKIVPMGVLGLNSLSIQESDLLGEAINSETGLTGENEV
jgi:hypothetical protein